MVSHSNLAYLSLHFLRYDAAKVRKVTNIAKFLGYSARFCDEWGKKAPSRSSAGELSKEF